MNYKYIAVNGYWISHISTHFQEEDKKHAENVAVHDVNPFEAGRCRARGDN